MEIRCGGLLFTSKFDSGNLSQVEKARHSDSDSDDGNTPLYGCTLPPDYEFNVWTKPDCAGTPYENGNRSWFYFGIKGYSPNKLIKLNIVNLNRQGKLYSQGMVPLVKVVPSKPRWERIRDRPTHQMVDGQFVLSFTYRFSENRGGTTYFAFCYPWNYTECQEAMQVLDKKYEGCCDFKPNEEMFDKIYYHRELLCTTMDQRRVDLITITSCENMTWVREPRLDKLFPDKNTPRAHRFHDKRVYFLSSRVHPGETPASFVFNGFLKFILRENDPRARMLRKKYIFKLIPMLNPDGVYRGHYRTDQKGVNLNRVYLNPDPDSHAPIFASRSLLLFYHHYYQSTGVDQLQSPDLNRKSFTPASPEGTGTPQEKHMNGVDFGEIENELSENLKKVDLKVEGIKKESDLKKNNINMHHKSLRESVYTPFQGDYLSIPPSESGVAYYVDLHGHASKRGCFIYGNHLEAEEDQVKNLLYPKLISLNSAHFDFNGCNFTERNMYLKDKRDGMSKEGSGRVAMFKAAGLIHSYTLECNYNTGRTVNCVPQAAHDNGRATPAPPAGFPPKYTPEIFEEVGRAVAVAALDMIQANPWSRILHSEFSTFENLKNWMIRYVRSSRGNPILPRKMGRISTRPPATYSSSANNLSANNNNNNSNGGGSNANAAAARPNRFSTTDLTKGLNNARSSSNVAARNVYNNSQLSNTSNRLAPVKTSSGPSGSTASGRAVNQSSSRFQNDAIKRQKNLIRVAVNGNSNHNTVGIATSNSSGLAISQMQNIHLQAMPGSEYSSKNIPLTLSYAFNGGKLSEILGSSRNFLTSASQSNPETGTESPAAGDVIVFAADYNSDSELLRGSPPSLHMRRGVPVQNASDPELAGLPSHSKNLLSSGVPVNAAAEDRLRSAKASNLGRFSNRVGSFNSNTKPPPSRLPVRSKTKTFIAPQVTKPPSLLYRGRNPSTSGRHSPGLVITSSRPTVVTNSSPSQVVVGPGGVVSISVSSSRLHGLNRAPDSAGQLSHLPISSSVYMSSPSSLSFQPLSVSQKPLLAPAQKDDQQPPISPAMQSYAKYERVGSTNERAQSGASGKDTSAPSARSSARKSGKGKSGKKKPLGRLTQVSAGDQRTKTPVGRETLGKKKFKSRARRVPSLKETEGYREELSTGALALSPRITNSPLPESNGNGDVPTFKTSPKGDLKEDWRTTLAMDEIEQLKVDALETSSYKVVLDSDFLFEPGYELQSVQDSVVD